MGKLLCATDGSESSRQAEKWAVSEAKHGSQVTFLYVLGVGSEDVTGTVGDVVILEAVEARRHKILQHCEEICRIGGVENTKKVVLEAHNIPLAIVEYATTAGFDHIIIGSRGHSPLRDLLLGSVAQDVIRHAHCAVTVVR